SNSSSSCCPLPQTSTRASLTSSFPSVPDPGTTWTPIAKGRSSSWTHTQVSCVCIQEPGASDDTTTKPSRLDSVTMRVRAFSLTGVIQIQQVKFYTGDTWVRLTSILSGGG